MKKDRVYKILIDARMYGLENAGIGRYITNLIQELKNLKTKEQFIILLRRKYFNLLNFPSNWKKVLVDIKHYSLEEQIKLPKILKQENPALVHFPHFNVPIFWKGKFIVTLHDLTMQRQGPDATNLPLPLYYIKRIPFYYVFRHAAINSFAIIVPTNFVKKDLVNYYEIFSGKVKVISEGLSKLPKSSKFSVEFKDPYFVYIGNAYPHKNLAKAIEAVGMLNKRHKKKILLVIGGSRNVFTDRLESLVRKLGAYDYVKLIGFLEDEKLSAIYKNSLGFIYPSLSEGLGLQGLEAMDSETILLASDIEVFREVYGDNAFYFDPKRSESVVSAMNKVVNLKRNERNKIIKKAKMFVHMYSWEKMAESTLQLYRKTLLEQ